MICFIFLESCVKIYMREILLSLCIPTYNRALYLKNSIETIICQNEFKTGEVEIIISDNASSDDTEKIGREYADRFENILYFRNERNIVNDNFPLALSRANGILRRLCNDTLCFREGSLRRMCDVALRYQDTKPYLCWMGREGKGLYEEKDFREGVLRVSYWMTSIGSFSIWDTECQGIAEDTAGAELMLWQVRKALELAACKNRMVLVNADLSYTPKVRGKNVNYGLYHVLDSCGRRIGISWNGICSLISFPSGVRDGKPRDPLYSIHLRRICADVCTGE